MKSDMNDLKKLVLRFIQSGAANQDIETENQQIIDKLFQGVDSNMQTQSSVKHIDFKKQHDQTIEDTEEIVEESLSIQDKEVELIKKALEKHNGKRKLAAEDLGISERTLYRKIKEYELE
jgi:transcriptional regulator with PAS, ATPase and Fis domain